jgi:cation-transporting ATPase E
MALVESRVRSPLSGAGLDDAEAARRHRQGLANTQPEGTSRSVADILRGNLLTRFNAILGALLVVVLVVGPIQDALFGIVLVTNALIGVVQELRAKRTLDRLALVSVPRARVVRSGVVRSLPVGDVVLGDTIEAEPGDQIVADGVVLAAHGLEVDESLLTGESEALAKPDGSEVLSGSFVVAGTGRYEVTRGRTPTPAAWPTTPVASPWCPPSCDGGSTPSCASSPG